MIKKYYSVLSTIGLLGVLAMSAAAFHSSTAFAQTTYTGTNGQTYSVPAGYQSYNYGTYYNPSTRQYYNPTTGQYSATAPTGPGTMNNGSYSVPSGYSQYQYGTYYNSSTRTYLDPATGFTSNVAPNGPTLQGPPLNSNGANGTMTNTSVTSPAMNGVNNATLYSGTNPGLPNTGAGGGALTTIVLLILLGSITVGALGYVTQALLV